MSRGSLLSRSFLAVSIAFVLCVVTQVFLAGLGVFQSTSDFVTHREFGYLFGWLTLLMLVLAIASRAPRRQVLLVVAIIVAFAFQSVFVALRASAPMVAALHPLNGFLILVLGLDVVRFAWLGRKAATRAAVHAPGGAEPERAPGPRATSGADGLTT